MCVCVCIGGGGDDGGGCLHFLESEYLPRVAFSNNFDFPFFSSSIIIN